MNPAPPARPGDPQAGQPGMPGADAALGAGVPLCDVQEAASNTKGGGMPIPRIVRQWNKAGLNRITKDGYV